MRFGLVVLVLLALTVGYGWLGFYQVEPDQQAVVLRLGRYNRTVGPGPHFHAWGIERVERARVTVTKKEEFGYRTTAAGPPPEYEDRPDEKLMLTSDENLVNVEFVLQYRIIDLASYLFKVDDVTAVIRDVSHAAMREVVAKSEIDGVLTKDKGPIEEEGRTRIQELLDGYGAGVRIQRVQLQDVEPPELVKDAFADVASAQQDRERLILEARGYAEQVVPQARGEAQETVSQAKAYRETRIRRSEGEAERFKALLVEYQRAPTVTRERLYLETLELVLPRMEKVIVQEGQSEKVLPYLPLNRRGVVK
jgi:membrane protease subunit HflK